MAKKEKTVVPEIVDSVEALEAKMKAMREAQKVFATFTQEQVDKIFYEAAMAANKQRIPLAKMAVEETQRGIVEDKVIKNHYAAEYIYNAYKFAIATPKPTSFSITVSLSPSPNAMISSRLIPSLLPRLTSPVPLLTPAAFTSIL